MAGESAGFGEFIIESIIGEGGMGKVYRARQLTLDRWVALKVLPRAAENKNFTERFYREARSAARLVHPNIIQIHTVGEHQGIPYFAMEYIEGEDLENILRVSSDPLSNDEVVEIVRAVAKALAVAMEQGIVHRDIKPANIMIAKSGLVKVMDFGLAKGVSNESVTQAGLVVGTPTYMSPEQGASKPVDTRSDLYSLGCVMYNCMCGKPPFTADNVASLLYKHMYETPEEPTKIAPKIHPEMEQICMKLLAKKPAERYQTPQELLQALAVVPCNAAAAELSLSSRATKAFTTRRGNASNQKTEITPENFLMMLPPKGSGQNKAVEDPGQSVPDAPFSRPGSGGSSRTLPPRPRPPMGPVVGQPRANLPPPPRAGGRSASQPATAVPRPTSSANSPAITQAPAAASPAAPVANAAAVQSPIPATRPTLPPLNRPTAGQPVAPPAAPVRQEQSPPPPPPVMKAPPPPPPPPPKSPGTATPKVPPPKLPPPTKSISPLPVQRAFKLNDTFQKLDDGRWSYKPELSHCDMAEGLAAEVHANGGAKSGGLGDCLLCSNWNKRIGCVLAFNKELELQQRYEGLQLLVEQSIAWAGAMRFDKAISLLDIYVKQHPEDPDGYRELARLYERPDYHGKDKRRAIVLYSRFAELAQSSGKHSAYEISRAQERVQALLALPPESRSSILQPGEGIAFQCFYRGPIVCFAYGVLNAERLVIARAGEMDPESGIHSSDMGGAMGRATTIFRRLKSDQAKREEQGSVKKELIRLSDLPLSELPKDAAVVLNVTCDQIAGVEQSLDSATNVRVISVKTPQTHQLLFSEPNGFKAEQCYELLRRKATAAK